MDFVEHLKSSIDIIAVVGEYVRLRKMGTTGRFVGLCPFHTEKSPSFNVNGTLGFYKCFGCGVGGDVIKFVQEIERISFYEALKLLAERYGIPMPKRSDYGDEESKLSSALLEMHEIAAKLFAENLFSPAGADARAYLQKRALTRQQAEEFHLGLSDASGNSLLQRLSKFSPQQIEASGLIGRSEDGRLYDRFRGRLMFPIHNESGKVIGFGGRALREGHDPKYLNSPETAIYKKSYVLYNLHRAKQAIRKAEHAVLVEGYMDVIGVYSAGVHEVIASCGTALTNTQVRAIKRHSEHIVVNFDPDNAGANAAEKSIQMLLAEGMRVKVLELDGGLDPDEYVKEFGAERYRTKLAQAGGYFHWLADRARKKFDMREAEGRMQAFRFLEPVIQQITDKLERATVAADVAGYLGVEPGLVLDQFRRSAGNRPAPTKPPKPLVSHLERMLLKTLLFSDDALPSIVERLKQSRAVQGFQTRRIFDAALQAFATEGTVRFASLEGRLEESDRTLLHSLVTADEFSEERGSPESVDACFRALQELERKVRREEMKARIAKLTSEGKTEEAMELMRLLDEEGRS